MKLKEIAKIWLNYHEERVIPKTFYYSNYLLEKHFGDLLDLDSEEIKASELLRIATSIESKKEAKKSISILMNIFDYANVLGIIQHGNPAVMVTKFLDPHIEKNHPALFTVQELKTLVHQAKKVDVDITVINALLTIIYTAQRRQEIIRATWNEIDFKNKIWTIPAERMKMKDKHEIPISTSVFEILNKQKAFQSNFIFPSRKRDNSINLAAPLALIYHMGYKGQQTLHGFRHSFSTITNSKRFQDWELIEAQLSHKIRGVRGVYNKSNYLNERSELMQWYDDLITKGEV